MELTKLKQFQNGKLDNLKDLPGFNNGYQDLINNAYANAMSTRTDVPGSGDIMKKQKSKDGGSGLFGSAGMAALSGVAAANPYAALAVYGMQGVMEGINRVKDNQSIIDEAGTSTGNIGGISYTRQNEVSASDVMGEYNKSMKDSIFSNPITSATQLFLSGSQNKEAQLAQTKSMNTGRDQVAGTITKVMRLNNAKQYGNPNSQYLYGVKDGKLPCFENGIISANGYVPSEMRNARVSNGEVLMDKYGNMTRAGKPGKKDNNDTLLAFVDGTDTVFTNKGGISDYVWETGDAVGGQMMMQDYQQQKPYGDLLHARYGKLPKMAEGWWGSAIPAVIGSLQSIDQFAQARRNRPYRPNTYVDNPYEIDALSTLKGLRVNPYPIMQQLRNAETRTNRAIDRSGGLSAAQRSIGRLSALNTTQQNIANTMAGIQQQNNSYRSNYAQAALNAGNASRQARMQANQWDLDYYSKAHAAQLGGMQMGARNMLQQLQSWQQNDFKRRQFNDTMALYRDDQKRNWSELDLMAKQNEQYGDYYRWLAAAKKNNWTLS